MAVYHYPPKLTINHYYIKKISKENLWFPLYFKYFQLHTEACQIYKLKLYGLTSVQYFLVSVVLLNIIKG